MGGPGSGRKPQSVCQRGHDLTNPDNVRIVKRKDRTERLCKICDRKRMREWWRKNHG